MFEERNRVREAFKCSRTHAEVLLFLMQEGFRTYSEFRLQLSIAPEHLRKTIVEIRKKGFDVYNIFGHGYTMSPKDRQRVLDASRGK